jgi:hypothetical protein
MDRILMWVVAGFRDPMRDIVDGDDAVEHDGYDKEEQEQCEIVEEGITHKCRPRTTDLRLQPVRGAARGRVILLRQLSGARGKNAKFRRSAEIGENPYIVPPPD